jgi:hypothetical protein
MRFVSSVNGSVALHVSADEVVPDRGLLINDLLSFVERTYRLTRPQPFGQNLPQQQPPFLLQGGKLSLEGNEYPIMQIAILGNGDIVTAQNTEIAEIILGDYLTQLDAELGFKFRGAKKAFTYLSNVVVQFDAAIDGSPTIFGDLERVIGAAIERPEGPFKIKRLAFGQGDPAPPLLLPLDLATFDRSDVLLERRTSELYSENKFFSSAPLKLKDHIRVLQQIEQICLGR